MSSEEHVRNGPDGLGAVPYIPLSEDDGPLEGSGQSVGSLVSQAMQHMSTLVRAEVELAKNETVAEAKKGVKGSILFIVAGVIGLYSSFFFFFFLGELLSEWLKRWAAFLIVFGLMLVTTGVLVVWGIRKFKKIRKPERTMTSVRETVAALKPGRENATEQQPEHA